MQVGLLRPRESTTLVLIVLGSSRRELRFVTQTAGETSHLSGGLDLGLLLPPSKEKETRYGSEEADLPR